MIKSIFILLTVFTSFLFTHSHEVDANHLAKKTSEQALKSHKFRMEKLPNAFKKINIPASTNIKKLKASINKSNDIQKIIKSSDLLSVMSYEKGEILIDEISSKLSTNDKMYSMSTIKSKLGYLVGHAVCDGKISSLNDPISKYEPQLKNTVYEQVSIQNMINMAAGDSSIWGKNYNIMEYSGLVLNPRPNKRKNVIDLIKSKGNQEPQNMGKFRYSNAIADLIARTIDNVSPNGFGVYFHTKLAEPAGNASEMFLLADANGWPIAHAFLYATRDDYMRMAIKISNDWNSSSCIGNFLRKQYEQKIKTNSSNRKNYGAFFWFDISTVSVPSAIMNGHGGQRTIIKLKEGDILSYHAIRSNFDQEKLENIFNK